MDSRNLMLGDFVICTEFGKNEIDTIECVEERRVFLKHGKTYTPSEYIKPILLTPEILARMCFTIEEEPKYDDTYTEDEYTATMKCVDSRKCEVKIEYNTYWKKLRAFNYDPHNRLGFTSIETQVEYVHELQHIMRMCNFNKTIEL